MAQYPTGEMTSIMPIQRTTKMRMKFGNRCAVSAPWHTQSATAEPGSL